MDLREMKWQRLVEKCITRRWINLYSSPNVKQIVGGMMGGTCRTQEKLWTSSAFWVESPEVVGRPKHRWEYNIKMDLKDTEWQAVGWLHRVYGRDCWWAVVNMVVNLRVPYKACNFFDYLSFWRGDSFLELVAGRSEWTGLKYGNS
jgi:hypothetical protein